MFIIYIFIMNSNQQKKPSINIPLDDEPKNITFQTKLFSPQAMGHSHGRKVKGVIKTSPKNNNVFKKDDNRSFSPNTIRSKLNKDNNPITNYKYFIETFTKFSKKQTDNTITQFRQIDKPWTSLSKKQKNKLFKQMTLDIILTHQRDRDNLEIIKHEFSTRDLSITKITAKKWIENIHKKYQDEETTLIKDTKTKLNAWIAHVDEHKLKLIKVNHDITKHNNFKSKRLDVLSERGKKALIKKIQDLLKEKVEIEKQIQKGEEKILASLQKIDPKANKNTVSLLKKTNSKSGLKKAISPIKYSANSRVSFGNLYTASKHGDTYQSNKYIPKNLNYILEDIYNGKLDESYIPKFNVIEDQDDRDKKIDEDFLQIGEKKNMKTIMDNWKIDRNIDNIPKFLQPIFKTFKLNFDDIEDGRKLEKYLIEYKKKIKKNYSDRIKNLSKYNNINQVKRVYDDIFFRNSIDLCIPHDLNNVFMGIINTSQIIKETLNKEVLYIAIQDGDNMDNITDNITEFFTNPSSKHFNKYIKDFDYSSKYSLIPEEVVSEASTIKTTNMYLHVYTFDDCYHQYSKQLEHFRKMDEQFKEYDKHHFFPRIFLRTLVRKSDKLVKDWINF